MDREKALQKIADFQLPYPDCWILKVIQAAVLSGAESLQIRQTSTDTELSFLPSEWPPANFETQFFNPASVTTAASAALRTAMWSVGLGCKRPFQLTLPGRQHTYFWDTMELTAVPRSDSKRLFLAVSHRTAESGKGIPGIRALQAARSNASVLQVVTGCAYTAPLELTVDNRRVDGLDRSPTHGMSSSCYPMATCWLEVDGTLLGMPPGNNPLPTLVQHHRLKALCEHFELDPGDRRPSGVAIISAHCGDGDSALSAGEQHSTLTWIRNGVVVQRERLGLPKRAMSVGIYASADGVNTDLSGFALRENELAPLRERLLRAASEHLRVTQLDFEILDRSKHVKKQFAAGGLTTAGVFLKPLIPPLGLALIGGGILASIHLAQGVKQLLDQLEKNYARLRSDWSVRFPLPAGQNERP